MANNNINELMKLPIWQMIGEEQYRIIQYALGHGAPHGEANPTMIPVDMPFAPKRTRIAGVHALALYLECCDSLVYKLRREGVLDEAIISRIGKKIVFDGEIARRCANEYQDNSKYDGREHHHY